MKQVLIIDDRNNYGVNLKGIIENVNSSVDVDFFHVKTKSLLGPIDPKKIVENLKKKIEGIEGGIIFYDLALDGIQTADQAANSEISTEIRKQLTLEKKNICVFHTSADGVQIDRIKDKSFAGVNSLVLVPEVGWGSLNTDKEKETFVKGAISFWEKKFAPAPEYYEDRYINNAIEFYLKPDGNHVEKNFWFHDSIQENSGALHAVVQTWLSPDVEQEKLSDIVKSLFLFSTDDIYTPFQDIYSKDYYLDHRKIPGTIFKQIWQKFDLPDLSNKSNIDATGIALPCIPGIAFFTSLRSFFISFGDNPDAIKEVNFQVTQHNSSFSSFILSICYNENYRNKNNPYGLYSKYCEKNYCGTAGNKEPKPGTTNGVTRALAALVRCRTDGVQGDQELLKVFKQGITASPPMALRFGPYNIELFWVTKT